ncbi:19579_t:CDS:2 [Gigaspora rosea]|nr:19579_t:CDS:2 [Gigaspora rosea]
MNNQFGNKNYGEVGPTYNANAQIAVNNVTQPPIPTNTPPSIDVLLYNELVEGRSLPSEEDGIDNNIPQQDGSMESGFTFP